MEKITKNPNILWAAIVLLLAIQFIPQVADFWADHFVDPIMADSKGEAGAKNAGKLRVEGAEYKVVDGDVFHFRFNV